MSARVFLAAAFAVALGAVARAETDPTALDVPGWTARVAELNAACGADRNSAACLVAATAVQSDMARAVNALGRTAGGDADTRALVRRVMAVPVSGVRTAATYALARLGPEPSDTPLLISFLTDPIPTLRRAAYGALKASPDPAARPWVERAKPQASGERWEDDRRPMDEATLGVALPPGSAPVYFEMKAWMDGGQVFTAAGTPDEVLAHFAAIAGSPVRPLAEVQAWFASDEKVTAALARYGNGAWYGDARVVALADGTGVHAGKPVRLAIVWQDQQLGKTGFALQWAPMADMPGRNQTPWSGQPPKLEKLDETKLGDPGTLLPAVVKPEADMDDTRAFMAVRLGDGAGALLYLEDFPQGAYRAEVEAMMSGPRLWLPDGIPVEPTEVKIAFANMPTDQPLRFDLISMERLAGEKGYGAPPGPMNPTEDIQGQAKGEIVWRSDYPLKPGVYVLRAFRGERKMDYDAFSQRKFVEGENAFAYRVVRVVPRAVTMSLDKTQYAPKEKVTVTYSDMPAAGSPGVSNPYITIVKAGAPWKDWQQYVYTEDRTSGTVTLEAPSTPGDYEVRAKFGDNEIVNGLVPFTVATAPPPPETPAAPPGTPAAAESNVKLSTAKPVFAPMEDIVVTVTGLPGNEYDFISVCVAGSSDHGALHYVYTKGAREGTFTLRGQPAGKYEIRVGFSDDWEPVYARLPIEVK